MLKEIILLTSLILLTSSCVVTRAEGDQIRSDLNRLQYELAQVQKNQSDTEVLLSQEIKAVSGKAAEVEESVEHTKRVEAAKIAENEQLMLEIRKLHGIVEVLQHELNTVRQTQTKIEKDLSNKPKAEGLNIPRSKSAHYDKSKELFDQKKYVDAIKFLDVFVEKYPKDKELLDDAYYYRGNSYFALAGSEKSNSKKNDLYKKAILSYQRVLTEFPKAKHADATLFKIASSMENLGFKKDAVVFYEELVAKHPKSELYKKAKLKISKLKPKGK